MSELKFPYQLFVGTGLKLSFKNESNGDKCIVNFEKARFAKDYTDIYNNKYHIYYDVDSYIPLLINPKNLSDSSWVHIFASTKNDLLYCNIINYSKTLGVVAYCNINGNEINEFNLKTGEFKHCNQQVLDRFYKEHSIPNFEELKKDGLIEEVERSFYE